MHLDLENALWTALQLARKTGDKLLIYLVTMALMECRSRDVTGDSIDDEEALALADQD